MNPELQHARIRWRNGLWRLQKNRWRRAKVNVVISLMAAEGEGGFGGPNNIVGYQTSVSQSSSGWSALAMPRNATYNNFRLEVV